MKLKSNKRAGQSISFFKANIVSIGNFFSNLVKAFLRFNNKEKILFFSLAGILVVLLGLEASKIYRDNTKLIPTSGGEYVEAISGEAKYFTPVLAKTDPEKAISHLVYSALIKIDENNQPQPDLATSWEISEDGLAYTFHLRPGVVFQKGQSFESEDVSATIAAIQDETNKSPLKETWDNIEVETPDPLTVTFQLPKKYGPFLYNCSIEIIDSGDAVSGSLSSSYNGTGPYGFQSANPDGSGTLVVSLKNNPAYYSAQPLISAMKFLVAKDGASAKKIEQEYTAAGFTGLPPSEGMTAVDKSFKTGRSLIIFFNLKREALKSLDLRKKLLAGTPLDSPTKLTLLALNVDPQRSKAEQFANDWKSKNLEIELELANNADYQDAVKKRDYDLLMYGYDWSYDRDPYLFWHSSQMDLNNFDGYSDKGIDIMLEDARLLTDTSERNKRYDEFFAKVSENALAIYFENESYPCFINTGMVKNISLAPHYGRPEDRFNKMADWYIKERRVRK